MGAITQTGLVVCASVDDYQSGVIKKHEHTRADKEEDRVKHIDYLDANDEPVFYHLPLLRRGGGDHRQASPMDRRSTTSSPTTAFPTPSGWSPTRP